MTREETVKNLLTELIDMIDNGSQRDLDRADEISKTIIEALSQEPKSGKWIELPKALNPNENPCKCSECGHILSFMNYYPKSNFCPNCGAKMVEPQESEEISETNMKMWEELFKAESEE